MKAADRDDVTTKYVMKRYVRVAHTGELEPGAGKTVDVNGTPMALFNVDGVVESENFESIHNHSAYALIECDKKVEHGRRDSSDMRLRVAALE